MENLAIKTSTSVRRLLDCASYLVLPGNCVLCKSKSFRPLDLCTVCEIDLPNPYSPCKICCSPLAHTATGSENSEPHSKICGDCLIQPPTYTRLYTPYLYQPPVDRLLWQFKFEGNLSVGKVLGQLLAQHIEENNNINADILVPVPLYWRRLFRRGFNQANELATTVGKILDIPIANNLIKRRYNTLSQQGLNRKQRHSNLAGSFAIRTDKLRRLIKGKSIALIDDVVTTGSTVEEIAKLLKQHGAAEINIWCVARTPIEY